jgi:AraC-like DNA-binding protein
MREKMAYQIDKLDKLSDLIQQYAPQEGINETSVKNVGTFKTSKKLTRTPVVDVPAIVIVVQGRKYCYMGNKIYDYNARNVLIMFFPMPVEIEFVEASPEKPFLAAGVLLNLGRLADMLLKVERVDGISSRAVSTDPSGVFSIPLTDNLLDPFIRLFESLANTRDAAILGESIVDEIYYRVLCDERGTELRALLQQRGHIQRISKAVEYIHQNIEAPISIDYLAEMVHMSRTSFYDSFRDVMHLSPLQYAKSVKLYKAQTFIREGKNASEAGYLVGYNSPAQFSREYKRHFGYAPSAT